MVNEHPFLQLFESFGRLPAAHAETVNRKAYEALVAVLETSVESPGRCILLRAPRAGYGKTHLLSRLQHQLGGSHEFIPLHAAGGRVDALSVTEDALKRLARPLPAANGLTVLDLVVRRLFAHALQPLVTSGEVPCQDREGALAALKNRPVETFDFHHPNAVTALWARDNFDVLGPRLSMELSQRSGLAIREVSFWVNAFFHYAATPVDQPSRAGALGLEVAGTEISDGVAQERLFVLLALLSVLMRVVLVADELEGFSADESSALKFAAFIGAIRQADERVDVILSMNKDIWDTAFLPRLSGGLADRLSEVLIELEPLADEEIIALYESRAPGLGKQVLERVDVSERHARGLIRAAGQAWTNAANEKPAAPVFAKPEEVVPVVSEPLPEPLPDVIHFPSPEIGDGSLFVAAEPAESLPFAPVFQPEPAFAPVFEAAPAAVASPFQAVYEESAPPVFNPPPYEFAAPVEASPFMAVPEPATAAPQFNPPPDFHASQPSASPSQPTVQPAQPVYPGYFNPPPQFHTPPEPAFVPVAEPPHSPYGTPPFEVVHSPAEFGPPRYAPPQQAPAPAPAPPEPVAEPVKKPEPQGDRVDDLLKQFRERYGRGTV